jgi:hypothetical protein
MPIFEKKEFSYHDDYVKIEPYDFYEACDGRDLDELKELFSENIQPNSLQELEWNSALGVLRNNRLKVSSEDEEVIKAIAKRYG